MCDDVVVPNENVSKSFVKKDEEEEAAPAIFTVSMVADTTVMELNEAVQEERDDQRIKSQSNQLIINAEKKSCPTCFRKTAKFICSECCLSKCVFYERRIRCVQMGLNRDMLLGQIVQRMSEKEEYSGTITNLTLSASNLKKKIDYKRQLVTEKRNKLSIVRKEKDDAERMATKLRMKVEEFQTALCREQSRLDEFNAKLGRRWKRIPIGRRKLLEDLFTVFFPLSPAASKTVACTNNNGDVARIDALAEASSTTYMNGRWIFVSTDREDAKSLTACTWKISNCRVCDYSKYAIIKESFFRPDGNSTTTADKSVAGALAALCYTAQLNEILSCVLDLCLPFKINHSDFVLVTGFREAEFDTSVVKLNTNVAILCLSQCLSDNVVSFNRPLYNLYNLSQNLSTSGISIPFALPHSIIKKFAKTVVNIEWQERERESPKRTDSVSDDWEQVSSEMPHWNSPASPSNASTLGDLLSNATSSVASLFR